MRTWLTAVPRSPTRTTSTEEAAMATGAGMEARGRLVGVIDGMPAHMMRLHEC
jgi:hypothetical protein